MEGPGIFHLKRINRFVENLKVTAGIAAIGGYVPPAILTNQQLENTLDTTNEWIVSRTGIKERHILKDPSMATSDMAALAIQNLLTHYGVDPLTVECLILATSTPDYILCPTAGIACEKAGLLNAWGFDMNAACSGFLYALSIAAGMIESQRHQRVLVVGADQMSTIVNYEDRNSCILFGDGAGAVLLEARTDGHGIQESLFRTNGKGASSLYVPAGGSAMPLSLEVLNEKKQFIHQDGRTVFKEAIRNMSATSEELLDKAGISPTHINWVVPHQANLRIIKGVSEEIGIPMEKFKVNIERYGNTTAATLPLCLWDFKNDFKEGDYVLLTAFGAGFNWGSTLMKW